MTRSKPVWRRLEQALKATDLLLQAGGFGMVVVDMGDAPAQAARRVPLASWFRFRRAVENTSTVLVAITPEACAKSCASLVLELSGQLPETISDFRFPISDLTPQPELQSPITNRKSQISNSEREFTVQRLQSDIGNQKSEIFLCRDSDGKSNESRRDGTNPNPPAHACILRGLEITVELVRSRLGQKKPATSAALESKTAWRIG